MRIDFFKIFSTKEVPRLAQFVDIYQTSQYKYIATFARGLKKDYAAVTLAVTSPLSNGATEGTNTKIKAFCRQTYGRAGNDLLNAKMTLSGQNKKKTKKKTELPSEVPLQTCVNL